MLVREIELADAKNFNQLIKEVENHSNYMLMEAGERKTTHEQQQKRIEEFKRMDNSTILLAEEGEELIGYLIAMGGTVSRNKHSAYIVIGILPDFRGKGVGSKLFEQLIRWAKQNSLSRLELTVVTENEEGIALYKKNGFEIEGVKRNSLKIDGESVNEYYMAKLV